MSLLKIFFRDSAIYSIPSFVNKGLSIFLVPLYTRVLSPSDYGALDIIIASSSLIHLTVALEITQGIARYYPEQKNDRDKITYASSAFWFTIVCYTVFLIGALIFSKQLSFFVLRSQNMTLVFVLGVVYMWFSGLLNLVRNQFRWEMRSKHYTLSSVILGLTTAFFSFSLAYLLRLGLIGILTGMISGTVVGLLYGIWHLRSSLRFRLSLIAIRSMLAFSVPLIPASIAVFISLYIDRIMINHFLTLNDVGIYGLGFRLAGIVNLLTTGFQTSLTPLIYSNYEKRDTPEKISTIYRFFVCISLLLFIFLSLFSSEILKFASTSEFHAASQVVAFLAASILFSKMYVFAPGISLSKKNHLILLINIAGASLNILLNWVLIPQYGLMGAASATLIGSAFVFLAYMFVGQRLYFIPHRWIILGLAILGSILTVLAGANIHSGFLLTIFIKSLLLVLSFAFFLRIKLISYMEIAKLVSNFKMDRAVSTR